MNDESGDLYGKIDALLGKRAGFSGGAFRRAEPEDFPLLTEVVEPVSADSGPVAHEAWHADPPVMDLHAPPQPWRQPRAPMPILQDWEAVMAPRPEPEPALQPETPSVAEYAQAVVSDSVAGGAESHATESPDSQETSLQRVDDARLEDMLRRVVREELERLLGRG